MALITLTISASASVHDVKGLHGKPVPREQKDSLTIHDPEFGTRPKMTSSVYPVEMTVKRRTIKIQSDHNQLLPIYRQNGTFYMVMRLNKGVNWINGLPSGHYFINNKPIVIK